MIESKGYRKVELWNEPRAIVYNDIKDATYSEMSEFDHGYLCGLIKEKRPKKILEVGVSSGGTTAIVLQALTMLGDETKIFSVDVLKKYYLDESKSIGFVAEEYKANKPLDKIEHILFKGYAVSDVIDKIGGDIDFVILDTMHSMPGEVLDFLTILPYLKVGAVVVLHDIILNQKTIVIKDFYACATQILMDVVLGNKYKNTPLDTIGAFEITKETFEGVESLFSALMITWEYYPPMELLDGYRKIIIKNYNAECIELFDAAVNSNKMMKIKRIINRHTGDIEKLIYRWGASKQVLIYGAGFYGRQYYELAKAFGLKVSAFVVSDNEKINEDIDGISVIHVSDISSVTDDKSCPIVLALDKQWHKSIIHNLCRLGYNNFLC